jgi:hypothetical protein
VGFVVDKVILVLRAPLPILIAPIRVWYMGPTVSGVPCGLTPSHQQKERAVLVDLPKEPGTRGLNVREAMREGACCPVRGTTRHDSIYGCKSERLSYPRASCQRLEKDSTKLYGDSEVVPVLNGHWMEVSCRQSLRSIHSCWGRPGDGAFCLGGSWFYSVTTAKFLD